MATGALAAYVVGRICNWVFLDPYGDTWSLFLLVCVPAGLLIGLMPRFWQIALVPLGASIGMYLGWLLRALLVRNAGRGPAVEIPAAFGIVGAVLGGHLTKRGTATRKAGLLGAFYGGLAMHFWFAVAAGDALGSSRNAGSPLQSAPRVLAGGIGGCVICALIAFRAARRG
jgi:hypothetical protein